MARFSEGSADLRIGGIRVPVDSDEAANRAYIDRQVKVLRDSDDSIHTRIDSEIRAIDSDLAALRATLDSEGGAAGSFRSLNDTPNSYDSEAGNFPRVNTAEDGLEFFDPFPVGSNNRLTTLNGLTIRSFGSNYIEFATFSPGVNFNEFTLNWDQPVNSLSVTGTNSDDFQSQFLTEVTNFQINGGANEASNFNSFTNFASSRTFTWSGTNIFRTNQAWNGNAVSNSVAVTLTSNNGGAFTDTGTFNWRPWNAATDTSLGNQFFDVVNTSYTVTLQVNNTSDITNNVSNATFTPANSGSGSAAQSAATTSLHTTVTFSGLSILSNTRAQGTVSGTAFKPSSVQVDGVDSDYDWTVNWDDTPNTQHRTWGIVRSAGGLGTLSTLSNTGYATPNGQVFYEDGSSPNRSRAQYGAGQTGVSLYVVTRGTINGIQETTNTSFPIDQAVPTPSTITLGHTGNTYTYNVYEIPLADTSGNFYTIT